MRGDASGHSFERALDEARRTRPPADGGDDAEPGAPHVRAELGLPSGEASGGKARFDEAMTWAAEPAPSPLALARAPSRDAGAEIRDELGLRANMTDDEMKRVWRAFVWRHHPDRQPPGGRLSAEARVAVANALYDRARRGRRRD